MSTARFASSVASCFRPKAAYEHAEGTQNPGVRRILFTFQLQPITSRFKAGFR